MEMAEILKTYRQVVPAMRFVGKKHGNVILDVCQLIK
jgi:hypothetical protein